MPSTPHHAHGLTTATTADVHDDVATLARRSRRYSQGRLLVACTTLGVIIAALGYGQPGDGLAWMVVAIGVAAFTALVVGHDRVESRLRRARARQHLDAEVTARRAREWRRLASLQRAYPTDADDAGSQDAPVADEDALPAQVTRRAAVAVDLDLDGRASLRQLLGRTASPPGEHRLRAWLEAAASDAPDDLAARQAAVAELGGAEALHRAALVEGMAAGRLRGGGAADVRRWIEAPRTLMASPVTAAALALVPLAAVLLVLADRAGARVAGGWVALVAVSWLLRWALRDAVGPALAGADALTGEARRYRTLFALWEAHRVEAPWLATRHDMLTRPTPASVAFGALARLVDLADLRWSHLPHVLVHSVTGWDLHVACALERWRGRHGARVAGWYDALADLDAASTIAALARLEEGWSMPVVDPARVTLEATSLGHPLIPRQVEAAVPLASLPHGLHAAGRVANDVALGPPGRVLVVTGSNMSGKSTLLRAIGLNVVLAQMGAPVCAGALILPPVRLETSLRLTDSLAAGVSYFMAALLRLKDVVAAADASSDAGPRVLYLLDEVLQGTNSEERQVAVRHIVAHLVRTPAIGALTTHDLHLVQTPEFLAHADHAHFAEQVGRAADGEPTLTFDYRLQPGPARSRNALALVRLVGLGHVSLDESTDRG